MGKAIYHAASSAKKFGGKAEDYLGIHTLIDSSRNGFPDLRHRALTHTSWFIGEILPRIFGETIKNSAEKMISVREIAEWHVLEDFNGLFIPSSQDFLAEMELKPWMDNACDGVVPPSRKKLAGEKKVPRVFQENIIQRPDRPCANAGRGMLD